MTTTLTAHGPEDLLAAVPVVLGFRPEHSLVMLTFHARHTFHARVDLPPSAEVDHELPELREVLLAPCLSHEVGRVAFVVYGDDPTVASAVAAGLVPAFEAKGVEVLAVLRAHEGWWWRVPAHPGEPPTGPAPYDDESHPFSAQAVFAGRVTHASREALRQTLAPLPEHRRLMERLVAELPEPRPVDHDPVLDVLRRCAGGRTDPDDDQTALVLRAIARVEIRDAALQAVTRDNASEHLRVWSHLLRRAPDQQVPDVAAVVAFCAWQAGDGALAWCALDRCFAVDDHHALGTCLAACLTRAVPPSAWEEVVEDATEGTRPTRESA
jgi:Domain of unknown function (DUF4192)